MKTKILGLLAVGLIAGPISASAATMLSQGQSAVFNFVLGSSSDPWNIAYTNATDVDAGDGLEISWFLELDAVNRFATFGGSSDVPEKVGASNVPGVQDGTFSIRYTARVGSFSVDPCIARGSFSASSPCFAPVRDVPEPGTLALLGLGLAGLGLSRRRKAD